VLAHLERLVGAVGYTNRTEQNNVETGSGQYWPLSLCAPKTELNKEKNMNKLE